MKLRNKKTGEIKDVESLGHAESLRRNFGYQVTLSWNIMDNLDECRTYKTLAELNDEWEDYKPAEPLIDFYDDRKLVRHWAEVHNIKEVWAHGIGDGKEVVEIYDVRDGLMRMTFYRPKKMGIDKSYTIAELCGKEEE